MDMPDELDAGPLRLVRWSTDDVDEALMAIEASIHELRPWMDWAQQVPTRSQQRDALADGHAKFEAGTDFGYLFREAASDEVVGGGGLHRRVGAAAIEIGYWVRSDRHGRGFATAAARALTDAAFAHLADVNLVEIHMDQANTASAQIPKKLGYELARTEAREPLAPGHTGHALIWHMTRSAWAA